MDTLIGMDKDVAELLFGHRPGRPTISSRAGGVISGVLGVGQETGSFLFHLALIAGAAVVAVKATSK